MTDKPDLFKTCQGVYNDVIERPWEAGLRSEVRFHRSIMGLTAWMDHKKIAYHMTQEELEKLP